MNETILEALQIQPLSEEEKSKRHILGRLWGPIATCKQKTRNGRKYNKALWEKALADELFHEKVTNKSLFLELGHPIGREETDMEKVCACIPEVPKIIGDELYTYVDILDTKNGRLLKTLCDYGFVPGISSRGSGELNAYNEVDPETFFLETWDIVQLPAVKLARLSMCESLDAGKQKLATVLQEAYNNKDIEEKKEMAETLRNLDLDVELEESEKGLLPGGTPIKVDQIPWAADEGDDTILLEEAEETEGDPALKIDVELEATEAGRLSEEELDAEAEALEDILAAGDLTDEEILAMVEVPEAEAEVSIASETETTDDSPEVEPEAELEHSPETEVLSAVQEVLDSLEKEESETEFDAGYNTAIEDVKDAVEELAEEEAVKEPKETDSTDEEAVEADSDDDIEPVDPIEEEPQEGEEVPEEEAEDNGTDEVIESLKEALRQNSLLESEVQALKGKLAVGNTKAVALTEELEKYKNAFDRVSGLAASSQKLRRENKQLTEQLEQNAKSIEELREALATTKNANVSLTESLRQAKEVNEDRTEVERLHESLKSIQDELTETETRLNEELSNTKVTLQKSLKATKLYESKYKEVLRKFAESKANMLGIPAENFIRSLNENFTMADIEAAYDSALTRGIYDGRASYGIDKPTGVRLNENRQARNTIDGGYEIDDSLLELAGLKK